MFWHHHDVNKEWMFKYCLLDTKRKSQFAHAIGALEVDCWMS